MRSRIMNAISREVERLRASRRPHFRPCQGIRLEGSSTRTLVGNWVNRELSWRKLSISGGSRSSSKQNTAPKAIKEDDMKYMMLIAADPASANRPEAEQNAIGARIADWWGEHAQKGKIVAGYQLQPAHTATTVKVKAGKAEVADGPVYLTDGPFNEAKETVGGYGILDVADLDEALAIVKSWPANNNFEVRPVIERG